MILNCNLVSLKINSVVCKFSIETRLNPIPIFNQLCLFSLSHLIKLELSECRIQAIEGHAFQGLDSLEWLAIDTNFISELDPMVVQPLRNINGMDIHQNPWNCTCRIKPIREVRRTYSDYITWKCHHELLS